MSSEWNTYTLSELCSFINRGVTPSYVENGGICVLNQKCIRNAIISFDASRKTDHNKKKIAKEKYLQPYDILVNSTGQGTLGRVAQIKEISEPITVDSHVTIVRPNSRLVHSYYLGFVIRDLQPQIEQLAEGSTGQTELSRTKLGELKIKVPEYSQQILKAKFLCALDDRIALLRETNATLESIAQAMFKSWFIDFDPVKARQQGQEPQGMDAATAALFPDAFQDSELGAIPAGWVVAKLEDVYDINPSRKLKKGEIAPYLGMSSVPTSSHSVGEVIDREMASGTKFINGDTLLARITPCLENGKTAYVDFLDDEQVGWGSTEFIVLRPKAPLALYHAYLLCRDSSFRTFAIQSISGTSGRQRVQNDVLGSYRLVFPSEEILTAFSDIIEPIQMAMTSNHKRSQTLASIRDTLLPRLISGKLRLPEAEAIFEEVGL